MLRSLKELWGNRILATDGEIGRVHDFFFDDQSWVVRYMVADTGDWLSGRLVLISPAALGEADWKAKSFPVDLMRRQVEESPGIEQDMPLSRQREMELHAYYNWPPYWSGGAFAAGMAGYYPQPQIAATTPPEQPQHEGRAGEPESAYQGSGANIHLRSMRDVMGYAIHATDGESGHIEDFLAEDDAWVLRYMDVDTRTWLPSKDVLLSVRWVSEVRWEDARIYVNMSREKIRTAPEYKKGMAVNRQFEEALHGHYGLPGYWAESLSGARPGRR